LQVAVVVMVGGALLMFLVMYFIRRDGLCHPELDSSALSLATKTRDSNADAELNSPLQNQPSTSRSTSTSRCRLRLLDADGVDQARDVVGENVVERAEVFLFEALA